MLGKPSHRLEKHLAEHGKKASAVVVEIAAKGMAITNGNEAVVGNTTLALKTKLRVEPNGEPAFEIEKRFRYQQLAVPSAGSRVAVVYDPDDHDKIMLDPGAPVGLAALSSFAQARASGASATDLNAMLARIREAQAESGGDREKMRELLQEQFAGQNVTVADASGLTVGSPEPDGVDKLAKLAKLHAEGSLTDAEFAAAKAKVIAEGL